MARGGCNVDKNSHRAETIQTRFRDYRSQEDHRRVGVRLCRRFGLRKYYETLQWLPSRACSPVANSPIAW